ncbi:unnamed protein product [Onchocerca flexuosa]|uniref:39S ribosomal protein L44, mitochondrial n=1 Tax=Onchocerca flexuosa TaxID=387005 RepID=A0A183HKI0_9BILA|nr:unnamed protein product [Onchocerca flexuosa]
MYFIIDLCRRILNPATIINKILIPNLKKPIRKVCAAVTIGKLLDCDKVKIAWSFDYTAEGTNYNDENTTTETEEKMEMIRLIGAIYSQYTFPLRNTVHGDRYFYIDSILSKLERCLTHSTKTFENPFTANALKYLDELIAKKEFSWQADYYLTKILLQKLLDARKVSVPEKPTKESGHYACIEWLDEVLPITYAGTNSKAFFTLGSLIDGKFCLKYNYSMMLQYNLLQYDYKMYDRYGRIYSKYF